MSKAIENLRKKKLTGGRRAPYRSRRSHEKGGFSIETSVGQTQIVLRRVRGGAHKAQLKKVEFANVLDPSTGTVSKLKIVKVNSNPANPDYQRRGIVTRGAIIETESGQAKVLSRPSQHAVVNAVLIK